jgi:ribosome-binding protein aMBF1 (putative translation factor)
MSRLTYGGESPKVLVWLRRVSAECGRTTVREEKKTRLRAKGWSVGDAREFLKLTPAEDRYIEMRLSLADALKKARARKSWTQGDVAEALGSSQSRVAKMESADDSVTLDLLIRSLLELGASRKAIGQALAGGRTRSSE